MRLDTAYARRCAQALLVALVNEDEIERVGNDLDAFAQILTRLPALSRLLSHPGLPAERRLHVLDGALDLIEAHPAARGLVTFLLLERRLGALSGVASAYRRAKDRRLRTTTAHVTTAVPIETGDRPRWEAALQKITGTRVHVEYHTDPALLGGAVAKIGSVLYDGSIRGSLERIRQSLLGE